MLSAAWVPVSVMKMDLDLHSNVCSCFVYGYVDTIHTAFAHFRLEIKSCSVTGNVYIGLTIYMIKLLCAPTVKLMMNSPKGFLLFENLFDDKLVLAWNLDV